MHAPKVAGETASRLADRTARSLDVTAAVADSVGPWSRVERACRMSSCPSCSTTVFLTERWK
jgi:hypothetical protein